jgi:hypothetical protein
MEVTKATGFSVAHYATSVRFWTHVAPAGLTQSFGVLWPVVVCGPIACALALAARRRHVPLALASVVAVAAYVVTPFSAGGRDGAPSLFALDLRFLAPALAVAAVLATALLSARVVVFIAGAVIVVNQVVGGGRWDGHDSVALCLLALVGAGMYVGPRVRRPTAALLAGTLLAVGGTWGWQVQADELADRYEPASAGRFAAYRWFEHVHDARIAVGGFADDYPLVGESLDNVVQYVGIAEPHGGWRPARSCVEWRRALAAGGYDYVVLSRARVRQGVPRETGWTESDAGARLVFRQDVTSVFSLDAPPNPSTC